MKKLLVLLLCAIAIAGCKKEYHCAHPYYNRSLFIGLTGFQHADLQTVELRAYKADGLFSSLLSTNTYTDTDFYYYHDTAKAKFQPATTADYIISVPATGNTYRLSGMTYNDTNEGVPYRSESPCNSMAYVRPPDSITVNGVRLQTIPYSQGGSNFDVYLVK